MHLFIVAVLLPLLGHMTGRALWRLAVLLATAGSTVGLHFGTPVSHARHPAVSCVMRVSAPPAAENAVIEGLRSGAAASAAVYAAMSRPVKAACAMVVIVPIAIYMSEKRKQAALIDSGEVS